MNQDPEINQNPEDSDAEAVQQFIEPVVNNENSYVLRLFVTGMTVRSTKALNTIKTICDEHLAGRYELEVIDIYQHPELARKEQIIAAPTLIRTLPEPVRRMIGDLSDGDRLLLGLDLKPKAD